MSWSAQLDEPATGLLDPAMLLRAYSAGLFPMADSRDARDVFWVEPRQRGILPIDDFHLPRSLAKVLRQERFWHSRDVAFEVVVRNCAAPAPGREESWINADICAAYVQLHRQGYAHSIETWDKDGRLVGGLYGVRLGAAFFGESMFSRADDASKVALAHLVARLRAGGFTLLDTQFLTPHLQRFGGREISRASYARKLTAAIRTSADWSRIDARTEAEISLRLADYSADYSLDPALPEAELLLPAELLSVAGPSGKRIVQLLSQTS